MNYKLPSDFAMLDICLDEKTTAVIAITSKISAQFNGFLQWNEGQKLLNLGTLEQSLAGITIIPAPSRRFLAVGQQGSVHSVDSTGSRKEQIGDASFGPSTKGPLRGVTQIDQVAYAVGMGRQIFKRSTDGIWERFDHGISIPDEVTGFEVIQGRTENDIYVAGWNGEIWHYQNKKWTQVESPISRIFTSICFDGDITYICGQAGTLLKRKGVGNFELITFTDYPKMKFDIWGMAWFQNALYMSTFQGLLKYQNEKLELMDLSEMGVRSYYRLRIIDGVMFSCGAEDLVSFDGHEWKRII